jgi:hypothetical protein
MPFVQVRLPGQLADEEHVAPTTTFIGTWPESLQAADTATLPAHTGFLSKPYSHAGLLAALQRLQPAH